MMTIELKSFACGPDTVHTIKSRVTVYTFNRHTFLFPSQCDELLTVGQKLEMMVNKHKVIRARGDLQGQQQDKEL